MNNLTSCCKWTRLSNAVAAGTSDVTSSAVFMGGPDRFNAAVFMVAFGTITSGAVTSVKLQQSSDDAAADAYADLEETAYTVADTDDNKTVLIELVRPMEGYIKVIVDRGTQNAVVDGIWCIQHGGNSSPVTQDATTILTPEIHVSPSEGTA
jgi:hypothetical protein